MLIICLVFNGYNHKTLKCLIVIIFFQEIARDEALFKRLTKETEMEKKISVQLTNIRKEKDVMKNNRWFFKTKVFLVKRTFKFKYYFSTVTFRD